MRSCLNGGGGCSPLTTGGGGAVRLRRGGAVGKSHSLLKHKEHHGKRVHSAPALSCSTASLTFVRTTELSGLMAQHIICRSLSSGRGGGGGAAKAARGRHFIRDGGGGRPPQGYAGSGAAQEVTRLDMVRCLFKSICLRRLTLFHRPPLFLSFRSTSITSSISNTLKGVKPTACYRLYDHDILYCEKY